MSSVGSVQAVSTGFVAIDLYSLRIDSVLDFNLYLHIENDYILYRAPSMPFTEKTRRALIENGIRRLYISNRERKFYQDYIVTHLSDIINDGTIQESSKSAIIYDSAKMLVKDLIEKPSLPENMRRSLALVESTALYLLKTKDAFHHLLKVMSFNYSTYTHSVNVCAFALALADRTGIKDKAQFHSLGTGALLHDIGKSKVPAEILDKAGPLSQAEMNIVKRHPQYGFEIVMNSDIIPHEAHYPILQHHEREDGSGYPHGLRSDDLHVFSKIVAIADVFDAMTTKRNYREAKDAYPALNEMYQMTGSFDEALLKEFTLLLGPDSIIANG